MTEAQVVELVAMAMFDYFSKRKTWTDSSWSQIAEDARERVARGCACHDRLHADARAAIACISTCERSGPCLRTTSNSGISGAMVAELPNGEGAAVAHGENHRAAELLGRDDAAGPEPLEDRPERRQHGEQHVAADAFERSPCIGRNAPRRIMIAAGKSPRRSSSVRPFTRAHIALPPVPMPET
jgi:hypothetical protein